MIHLLWPTARPQQFIKTHKHWLSTAQNPNNIQTTIAVDTPEEKQQLPEYNVIITNKQKPGVAYATYELTKNLTANPKDIIILASDDFYPPEHWDTWITEQLNNYDGCLLIKDGYQTGGCITLPIMTYNCLYKLNKIIYHPSYNHQYSDAELWVNLNEMGLIKNLRGPEHPLFQHKHWANGLREYDHIDHKANSCGGTDDNNFKNRCKLPLSERLKC